MQSLDRFSGKKDKGQIFWMFLVDIRFKKFKWKKFIATIKEKFFGNYVTKESESDLTH